MIEESKHTPGPWRWIDGDDANIPCGGRDLACLVGPLYDETSHPNGRVHLICDFGNSEAYYPTEGAEPSGADKRLIAAAPELLAELKSVVDAYATYYRGEPSSCLKARALIAKVEATNQNTEQ